MERAEGYATALARLAALVLVLMTAVACGPTTADIQLLAEEKRKLAEEGKRIEEKLRQVKAEKRRRLARVEAERRRRAEEDWQAKWCPEKVRGLTELIDGYEEERAKFLRRKANLQLPAPGSPMEAFKSYVREERAIEALGQALSTLTEDMPQDIDSYWKTNELERCKGTSVLEAYFHSDQYKFVEPAINKWQEEQRKLAEEQRQAEEQKQAEEKEKRQASVEACKKRVEAAYRSQVRSTQAKIEATRRRGMKSHLNAFTADSLSGVFGNLTSSVGANIALDAAEERLKRLGRDRRIALQDCSE